MYSKGIFGQSFCIAKRESDEDWKHVVLDETDVKELVKRRSKGDTFEFEDGTAVIFKVSDEPRTIDTQNGPWEILDVIDKDDKEWIISLGHSVLNKAVHDLQAKLGALKGQIIVIVPLGKPKGKKYYDYVVYTFEEYKKRLSK
jgi:hypothetical protein